MLFHKGFLMLSVLWEYFHTFYNECAHHMNINWKFNCYESKVYCMENYVRVNGIPGYIVYRSILFLQHNTSISNNLVFLWEAGNFSYFFKKLKHKKIKKLPKNVNIVSGLTNCSKLLPEGEINEIIEGKIQWPKKIMIVQY